MGEISYQTRQFLLDLKTSHKQGPAYIKKYIAYLKLPDDLQKIVFAPETADIVYDISNKHQLKTAQRQEFAKIIGSVLIGELAIADFVKTIKDKCRVDESKAVALARDINQAIFLPVKDSLKQVHNLDTWPREAEGGGPKQTEPKLEGNIVNLKNNEG